MKEISLSFVDPHLDNEKKQILLPKRQSNLASGCDLVASNPEPITIEAGARALIPTGVAIALPAGVEAQVRSRSGLALKHGLMVLNSPGTIDADYRGEIKVILANLSNEPFKVEFGLRIAQLVIASVLLPSFKVVEVLGASPRGDAGFGSTGMNA
ncbi:MAG: dUTP diphosphatase [Myxococcales bacterium]|nr:dUTP diphosphatase [Myxococcales bacterium]USN51024.1 MAG: dUTP diphosphatase [Myxococcales bacterium]